MRFVWDEEEEDKDEEDNDEEDKEEEGKELSSCPSHSVTPVIGIVSVTSPASLDIAVKRFRRISKLVIEGSFRRTGFDFKALN